ncbi:MAG: energy-coupling factor transporter transmembrane protein EcfT [Desulfobacterales bacterium]|nr:energy-coupling factor transporter transmembrane protein EcfT [Desulfobacterales bacterium]
MAELSTPHRRWTPARLDVRLKLALLCTASLASLQMQLYGLLGLLLPFALLAIARRASLGARIRELRWVFWILALVFAARALFTEGAPLVSLGPVAVTRQGLQEAVNACLRLALMFVLGGVFIGLTPTGEIKAAVQWYLRPIPGVPAARVATMLGLIARFIPVIFAEAARTSEAQRARLGDRRRSPVGRLATFGLPLVRRIVLSADRLALAMEARCYSELRTEPELAARGRDFLAFGLGLAMLAVALAV